LKPLGGKMLSTENFNKLNMNYLYSKSPPENKNRDIFWCRNWTFRLCTYNNVRAYMRDTYFNDSNTAIEVTDENIDEFKIIFDFRDMEKIRDDEWDEYNLEDIIRVATNSGGYSCGGLGWVKKGTVKSKERLIKKQKDKIESLEWNLKWAKQDLEKLQKDNES
jgi:hypothetical protein